MTSARCPSVCLSVSLPKLVLTVRFSKFFFCWKGMTSNTYLLYFLSVRTSGWTDRQNRRSVSDAVLTVDFKNSFFVGKVRHQKPIFDTLCPSVRAIFCPSVILEFVSTSDDSNRTILKIYIRYLSFIYKCPSVCPYHKNFFDY